MQMMAIKNREAYTDQRNVGIFGSKFKMRASNGQIHRIINQQRAHMPQIISDMNRCFCSVGTGSKQSFRFFFKSVFPIGAHNMNRLYTDFQTEFNQADQQIRIAN
ncbi:hypothetical protein D3C75_633260 [compost metagenome]